MSTAKIDCILSGRKLISLNELYGKLPRPPRPTTKSRLFADAADELILCFISIFQVTKNMAGVVKSMEAAAKSMDLQKVREFVVITF